MIEQFGHVVWRAHQLVSDGADDDLLPDSRLLEGTVRFTPGAPVVNFSDMGGEIGLTTHVDAKSAELEVVPALNGVGEESRLRKNGAEGIWLMASVDHRGSPQQWAWTASFDVYTVEGTEVPIPEAKFYLEPNQKVDLSTAISRAGNYKTVSGGLLVPSVFIHQDPGVELTVVEADARRLGATHLLDMTSETQDLWELT